MGWPERDKLVEQFNENTGPGDGFPLRLQNPTILVLEPVMGEDGTVAIPARKIVEDHKKEGLSSADPKYTYKEVELASGDVIKVDEGSNNVIAPGKTVKAESLAGRVDKEKIAVYKKGDHDNQDVVEGENKPIEDGTPVEKGDFNNKDMGDQLTDRRDTEVPSNVLIGIPDENGRLYLSGDTRIQTEIGDIDPSTVGGFIQGEPGKLMMFVNDAKGNTHTISIDPSLCEYNTLVTPGTITRKVDNPEGKGKIEREFDVEYRTPVLNVTDQSEWSAQFEGLKEAGFKQEQIEQYSKMALGIVDSQTYPNESWIQELLNKANIKVPENLGETIKDIGTGILPGFVGDALEKNTP